MTIMEKVRQRLDEIHESTLIPSPILTDGITFNGDDSSVYGQDCSVKLINGIQIHMMWGPGLDNDINSVEAFVVPQSGYEFPEDSYCIFNTPSYILVPGFNEDTNISYLSIDWDGERCIAGLISAASKMHPQQK